jgi:hypothetical protein
LVRDPVQIVVGYAAVVAERVDKQDRQPYAVGKPLERVSQGIGDADQIAAQIGEGRGVVGGVGHRSQLAERIIAKRHLMVQGIGDAGRISDAVDAERPSVIERIDKRCQLAERRVGGRRRPIAICSPT